MTIPVWVGGIWHETNTFATDMTHLDAFDQHSHVKGQALIATLAGTRTEVGGILSGAQAMKKRGLKRAVEIIPGMWAAATPSGLVARDTYDRLKGELLSSLKSACQGNRPVEGVLLALHGAMVAQGVPDVEGDLIRSVRGLVGESVPIVVTLDLHANISAEMAKDADALIGYETYPHVDPFERGVEAVALMGRMLNEGFRPTGFLLKPPLVPNVPGMYTVKPPMADLLAMAAKARRDHPDILSLTVAGGYPYADVPFAGLSIYGVSKGDPERLETTVHEIAAEAMRQRDGFFPRFTDPATAVAEVMETPDDMTPIALIDIGDNIGGGSPGDGTVLLKRLIDSRVRGVLAAIADGEAVARCFETGVGKSVRLMIGGKVDTLHGPSIPLEVRVEHIFDGRFTYKGSYMTGREVFMGRSAVVTCGDSHTTLLLSERKTMPFDQEQFRCAGLDPTAFRVIILKSAIAWRAAYETIVKRVIEVDTPGVCAADVRSLEFEHLRRPVYPFDTDVSLGEHAVRQSRRGVFLKSGKGGQHESMA